MTPNPQSNKSQHGQRQEPTNSESQRVSSELVAPSHEQWPQFQLPAAIEASPFVARVLREQSWVGTHPDSDHHNLSTLKIAVSTKSFTKVMEGLLDFLDRASMGDVMISSGHGQVNGSSADFCRQDIDFPILRGVLMEYQDLCLNDGCFALAIFDPETKTEVHLDEDKLLWVYSKDKEMLEAMQRDLEIELGIARVDTLESMVSVDCYQHTHVTTPELTSRFDNLVDELGASLLSELAEDDLDDCDDEPEEDWRS